MSVANTTGRLATPTTTSNIFAAAGGGPTPLKSVGGENNMGIDVNQVQNILNISYIELQIYNIIVRV